MAHDQVTGIGLRQVYVGQRDDDGTMKILGSPSVGTAYYGRRAMRARALTVTPSDPQRVTVRGDDRPYHTFNEAPTDMPTGELRVQESDTTLIALITGVTEFGSDNSTMIALSTDKLGSEDPLFIWGSRKAIDSSSAGLGTRVWETYIFLNVSAAVKPPTFEDQQVGETVYSLSLNASSVDQFGRTFSNAVHGCTEAAYILVKTRYKFFYEVFAGNGALDDFTLSKGASTIYNTVTSPVNVFVDGVETAHTVSSAGVVTITGGPPADGAKIVCQYEYSD